MEAEKPTKVEAPVEGPPKLSAERWVGESFLALGRAPELVRAALDDGEYTRDEAQAKIEQYLARPIG